MKTKFNFLLAVVLSAISCSMMSCNKDSDSTSLLAKPSAIGFNDIRKSALSDITITRDFKGSEGLNFKTAKGTSVYIPGNCLRDQSNNLVEGNVTLQFAEIYDRGNMVLTNKPVMGRNYAGHLLPLVTGGQFFIEATKGSEKLNLGCPFTVNIPASLTGGVDAGMILWKGNINEDGNLVWEELNEEATGQGKRAGMNINEEDASYKVWASEFGWTNVDRFFNAPDPKTQIKVTVPEGYDSSNSAVYLSYEGERNLLAQLDMYNPEEGYFTEHYGFLPVGMSVHVIFASESNGSVVYAIKKVTIVAKGIISFSTSDLQTTTKSNLINIINNLN